jgi:hypothetical protein
VKLVCIRARVGVAVGDVVEVPDGAEFSDLYFAGPDSVEAKTAQARAPQPGPEPETPPDAKPPGDKAASSSPPAASSAPQSTPKAGA